MGILTTEACGFCADADESLLPPEIFRPRVNASLASWTALARPPGRGACFLGPRSQHHAQKILPSLRLSLRATAPSSRPSQDGAIQPTAARDAADCANPPGN